MAARTAGIDNNVEITSSPTYLYLKNSITVVHHLGFVLKIFFSVISEIRVGLSVILPNIVAVA